MHMPSQTLLAGPPLQVVPSSVDSVGSWLLDIQTIYLEAAVAQYPRGQQILARFPNAQRIEVNSHWQIPGLFGFEGNIADWNKIKRNVLVLGVKKSLRAEPNTRSSDFIAPSHANGCAMSCSYCYVPRQKGYANPITTFVNIEGISAYLARHATKLGRKAEPSQIDAKYWVYDIGCNCDCSVDALLSDNVRDLITLFRTLPTAKASFATKYINRDLLNYDPQQKTRIRLSLMPQAIAKIVDVRTSSVAERIASINDFYAAGYEVHLNFSPVIHYEGWQADYRMLFDELAQVLRPEVKAQRSSFSHTTKSCIKSTSVGTQKAKNCSGNLSSRKRNIAKWADATSATSEASRLAWYSSSRPC